MSLLTKYLTPRLTCELDNPSDDWLELTSPTNHPVGSLIRESTREGDSPGFIILVNMASNLFTNIDCTDNFSSRNQIYSHSIKRV